MTLWIDLSYDIYDTRIFFPGFFSLSFQFVCLFVCQWTWFHQKQCRDRFWYSFAIFLWQIKKDFLYWFKHTHHMHDQHTHTDTHRHTHARNWTHTHTPIHAFWVSPIFLTPSIPIDSPWCWWESLHVSMIHYDRLYTFNDNINGKVEDQRPD